MSTSQPVRGTQTGKTESGSMSRPKGSDKLEPEVIMTDNSEKADGENKPATKEVKPPATKKTGIFRNRETVERAIADGQSRLAKGMTQYDDGQRIEPILTQLHARLRELKEEE